MNWIKRLFTKATPIETEEPPEPTDFAKAPDILEAGKARRCFTLLPGTEAAPKIIFAIVVFRSDGMEPVDIDARSLAAYYMVKESTTGPNQAEYGALSDVSEQSPDQVILAPCPIIGYSTTLQGSDNETLEAAQELCKSWVRHYGPRFRDVLITGHGCTYQRKPYKIFFIWPKNSRIMIR